MLHFHHVPSLACSGEWEQWIVSDAGGGKVFVTAWTKQNLGAGTDNKVGVLTPHVLSAPIGIGDAMMSGVRE